MPCKKALSPALTVVALKRDHAFAANEDLSLQSKRIIYALRIYKKMIKELIFVLVIVGVSVALLCVRLLLGRKNVVNTHIEGNHEMERRGIHCVLHQDMEARRNKKVTIENREK